MSAPDDGDFLAALYLLFFDEPEKPRRAPPPQPPPQPPPREFPRIRAEGDPPPPPPPPPPPRA